MSALVLAEHNNAQLAPATLNAVAAALLWLLVGINLVSPRFVAHVDGLLLAAGLAPLLGVGVLGWAFFFVVDEIERRLLPWAPANRR